MSKEYLELLSLETLARCYESTDPQLTRQIIDEAVFNSSQDKVDFLCILVREIAVLRFHGDVKSANNTISMPIFSSTFNRTHRTSQSTTNNQTMIRASRLGTVSMPAKPAIEFNDSEVGSQHGSGSDIPSSSEGDDDTSEFLAGREGEDHHDDSLTDEIYKQQRPQPNKLMFPSHAAFLSALMKDIEQTEDNNNGGEDRLEDILTPPPVHLPAVLGSSQDQEKLMTGEEEEGQEIEDEEAKQQEESGDRKLLRDRILATVVSILLTEEQTYLESLEETGLGQEDYRGFLLSEELCEHMVDDLLPLLLPLVQEAFLPPPVDFIQTELLASIQFLIGQEIITESNSKLLVETLYYTALSCLDVNGQGQEQQQGEGEEEGDRRLMVGGSLEEDEDEEDDIEQEKKKVKAGKDAVAAWDLPVSPMDKFFRQGYGGIGQEELDDVKRLLGEDEGVEEIDEEEPLVFQLGEVVSFLPSMVDGQEKEETMVVLATIVGYDLATREYSLRNVQDNIVYYGIAEHRLTRIPPEEKKTGDLDEKEVERKEEEEVIETTGRDQEEEDDEFAIVTIDDLPADLSYHPPPPLPPALLATATCSPPALPPPVEMIKIALPMVQSILSQQPQLEQPEQLQQVEEDEEDDDDDELLSSQPVASLVLPSSSTAQEQQGKRKMKKKKSKKQDDSLSLELSSPHKPSPPSAAVTNGKDKKQQPLPYSNSNGKAAIKKPAVGAPIANGSSGSSSSRLLQLAISNNKASKQPLSSSSALPVAVIAKKNSNMKEIKKKRSEQTRSESTVDDDPAATTITASLLLQTADNNDTTQAATAAVDDSEDVSATLAPRPEEHPVAAAPNNLLLAEEEEGFMNNQPGFTKNASLNKMILESFRGFVQQYAGQGQPQAAAAPGMQQPAVDSPNTKGSYYDYDEQTLGSCSVNSFDYHQQQAKVTAEKLKQQQRIARYRAQQVEDDGVVGAAEKKKKLKKKLKSSSNGNIVNSKLKDTSATVVPNTAVSIDPNKKVMKSSSNPLTAVATIKRSSTPTLAAAVTANGSPKDQPVGLRRSTEAVRHSVSSNNGTSMTGGSNKSRKSTPITSRR